MQRTKAQRQASKMIPWRRSRVPIHNSLKAVLNRLIMLINIENWDKLQIRKKILGGKIRENNWERSYHHLVWDFGHQPTPSPSALQLG